MTLHQDVGRTRWDWCDNQWSWLECPNQHHTSADDVNAPSARDVDEDKMKDWSGDSASTTFDQRMCVPLDACGTGWRFAGTVSGASPDTGDRASRLLLPAAVAYAYQCSRQAPTPTDRQPPDPAYTGSEAASTLLGELCLQLEAPRTGYPSEDTEQHSKPEAYPGLSEHSVVGWQERIKQLPSRKSKGWERQADVGSCFAFVPTQTLF
eukprot:1182818-Rhodomonas_salina.4